MEIYKDIHILNISTTLHQSNQYVMSIGETPPGPNEAVAGVTLYNNSNANPNGHAGRYETAFRLSLERNKPTWIQIPLTIRVGYEFKEGGTYSMSAEDGMFKMCTQPFTITLKNRKAATSVESIGPFYAEVTTDCPFNIKVYTWRIYYESNTEAVLHDGPQFKMYFFLGSSALSLNGLNTPNVHLHELIKWTIPPYEDTAGKRWDEIERERMQILVLRFWRFGDKDDFRYDSDSGDSSFFLENGEFLLANMLMKTKPRCNCFDLAALMYTAFKSFGRRHNGPNAPETDFFDIKMHKVENWGYILPSSSFGFQDTALDPVNQPFGPVSRIPIVERDDPNRSYFIRHCFNLVRNCRSEWKVIDICLAYPTYNPYPDDESETHTRQDGCCSLGEYLALRDVGWYRLEGRQLEDVNITSICVDLR